jgi:hypothetical protein
MRPEWLAAGAVSPEQTREFFSAAELAEMGLPGLPGDKRSIARRAQEERWSSRTGADGALLVRPRQGRGGGVEFHFSLLPGAAQIELARRGIVTPAIEEAKADSSIGSWQWLERQPDRVRSTAEFRLKVVSEIELLEGSGMTRSAALAEASRLHEIGKSTLWSWLALVEGIAPANRLPALAPRRTGGGREAAMDEDLWTIFKSDYLRPAEPTLTSCYRRTAKIAEERGLSMPSERTFRRRLEREIDPGILTLRRKGEEALRRSIPAQRRHVTDLHALECVNIDGHKFDVFVTPPPGSKSDKPLRPVMVALQDVRSSKIVAFRIGESESAALARLAFADLFRDFGIPRHCVLDNGRGFASKWITGGTANRFRFKVKAEEPTGLLTALGVQIHWALPYRGQSKPIERAFRDMCDTIAKHPAMDGAYTGNSPTNKPHDYGKRAVPWDEFVAHVGQGIADHNARIGRRGRDYAGRSFDQVFAASFAAAPIAKATPEQLRMALLAAEQKTVNRQTGAIELFGNRYWSPDCGRLAGEKVAVRFDPDDLHSEIHLYGQDGEYLCSAEVIEDNGFLDVSGAKATQKRWADHRRRIRDGLEAERLLSAEELAAMQPDRPMPELPEPGAVRIVHHRGQTAAALKPQREITQPAGKAAIDRMRGALLRVVEND